jgi:hypothetical protein
MCCFHARPAGAALGYGTWLGVAAPAESATPGARQLASDQVVGASIMSRMVSSGSEPSMTTVFQWRLLRWYPGRTAALAARSTSASSGSHLRLTRSESAPSWDRGNILPASVNTDVSGPNGNVSSAALNERQ